MSANNIIIIKELINGGFTINETDVDCGGIHIGKAKTLEEAIEKTQKYMRDWEVEYGYIVVRQGEEKKG